MKLYILALLLLITSSASNAQHFISDIKERKAIYADFEARRANAVNADIFDIFNDAMTLVQREAMTFLYAYMPLADIADHSAEYFLENVDYALRAKEEMSWGKSIPEREFRHFVLPPRVNNENLDGCRKIFYEELKPRIEKLSLYDAVLEVNHWCHEKVNYRPSDARTSSPLASIRTAYGRCGEESTLTVAALRAVGIPARQVYTPRWAHTDDNHAWVEAWVDGKWYFLGACEPEPVLNLGWFNAPASRGMLMHTKVFGRYNGPEETMLRTPRYTEINVIDNYAPTAKAEVTVIDESGTPVEQAKVEFKVYNYAEYYTVATKQTDVHGKTSLTAGKGDMLVWASKDGRFGYDKLSFGKNEALTLKLDKTAGETEDIVFFDITPPEEGANMPEVSAEQRAENDRRFAEEDSIRNAYVATFPTAEAISAFAKEYGYDEETAVQLIQASRGNYKTLIDFLAELNAEQRSAGLALLQEISEKDLRDVAPEVLRDHLDSPICPGFEAYVRNPRVANEMLVPYKAFFKAVVSPETAEAWRTDPMRLVQWVAESIRIDAHCNLGGAPITPVGVWKSRVADSHSRNIFFVTLARSMGIPARIDGVTGKVQLMQKDGATLDVNFGAEEQSAAATGCLIADYEVLTFLGNPKYYSHFTLSKITPEGRLQLLSYDENTASWHTLLRQGLPLDEGSYLLTTGTRLAKGGVLARSTFFNIEAGKTTTLDLIMRDSGEEVEVIGNFNSESLYSPLTGDTKTSVPSNTKTSVLLTTGRGYYVIGILGIGGEPTNHALRDIAALARDFEVWGRKIILLFHDEAQMKKFNAEEFGLLPSTVCYGIDTDGSIQQQIVENMELKNNSSLPLFIIGDTFNRVVFCSQGYTIGLGEQMIKVIRGL